MKRRIDTISRKEGLVAMAAMMWILSSALLAQNPRQSLDNLLSAHRAWRVAPVSVEITGSSNRKGVTGPVKITATREEETLTEYGDKKHISSRSSNFTDDGKKLTYAPTLDGFGQTDITGLFFIAQLTQRPIQVDGREDAPPGAARVLHVSDTRKQKHFSRVRVEDKVDIHVAASGLLAGISRSFYEQTPRFAYTLSYAFSDYRQTAGVLLPYRIETYLKGNKIETIDVTAYQFDVPAPPSQFQPRRSR